MHDAPSLYVHRASRLETLRERLAERLDAERPTDPLQAQTVVAGHRGLLRWLADELARRPRRSGRGGIAANLDLILPSAWLERGTRRLLGEGVIALAPYRREALRWRLYALIDPNAAEAISPALLRYLAGPDPERRRFRLADRLAALYGEYQIYRRDWLDAWQRGEPGPDGPDDWQGRLWRRLRQDIGQPHRAERTGALIAALAETEPGPEPPLHLFGLSHLPPDLLTVLQHTATRQPVHLYFPDPCREHWGYLRSQREILRQGDDPERLHLEVGHPLLAKLGRIGRQFGLALIDLDAADDWRDPADEADPDPQAPLLTRLQDSLRTLEPSATAPSSPLPEAPDARARWLRRARADGSLRVHACHTRLRELEALRDALLARLAADPELQPREIAVLAPDIAAYAALIPVVFGEPGEGAPLPWHLADVGLARGHPLFSAFIALLGLPNSRFAVEDVLALLEVTAVARRLGLSPADRERLGRWIARAGVAWGLDGEFKAALCGAAVEQNSWRFGLDRLLAGVLVGEHEGLIDGVLPATVGDGPELAALGRLARLLERLGEARTDMARGRPASAWSVWLLDLIDALFEADPNDHGEREALAALRRVAAAPALEAGAAGIDPELPWPALAEALRRALAAVPERQPFLAGGIVFCGLVPQRSIPFKVLAVLGLNDGEFPRPDNPDLDLIRRHPRPGDRDSRHEDRYLFLEALMSARHALHLSYLGEDPRDGRPRNPAAPLADLLDHLDDSHGLRDEDDRPWLTRHPLQAFDTRYHRLAPDGDDDPRLFTYRTPAVPTEAPPSAFLDRPAADLVALLSAPETDFEAQAACRELPLRELHAYWRDPARHLLRDRGKLDLAALAPETRDGREPLDARSEANDPYHRLRRRLLAEALSAGRAPPKAAPDWLAGSGQLPAAGLGRRAYAALAETVEMAWTALGPPPPLRPCPTPIRLALTETTWLSGRVEGARIDAEGRLWLIATAFGREADFREWLPLLIDCAALRGSHPDGEIRCTLIERRGDTLAAAERAAGLSRIAPNALHRRLRDLARLAMAANEAPLWYFPRTTWAYARRESPDEALEAARRAWLGDGQALGERDAGQGHALWLTRGRDFLAPGSADLTAFAALARSLHAWLRPEATDDPDDRP